MSAGIGSEVGLYMDTQRALMVDDYIQTPTARTYQIVAVRRQQTGKHKGRAHIRALVVPAESVPKSATVHPIAWYAR